MEEANKNYEKEIANSILEVEIHMNTNQQLRNEINEIRTDEKICEPTKQSQCCTIDVTSWYR